MEIETVENKEKKRKKGFWYWIRRNFYPFILIFSAFVIVLTISLVMLSKAQWFRYWVSGFIFTTVNNELQEGARFEFKDIEFSYLLGIKLTDVILTYKGDTILYTKELEAGLKIAPLLRNKIIVNEIIFDSPQINFYRSALDSLWIIDKIIKPSTDTTVSEPPNWLVEIKKIRFRNGDLRFFDSTIAYNKSKQLDFDHFRLKSFYLNMNAELDLSKSKYKAVIKELSFYDSYSGNKVKEFELAVAMDTTGIKIDDLYFRTSKSEFELNADIKNFNVFDDADIEKARFKVNLNSSNFDIDEIARFIPAEIPVSGNYSFSMQSSGKLNHFFTQFQDLKIGNSYMNFSANIKNVINDDLNIEFDFEDSKLLKFNMDEVIKKLEIEGIPDFGEMTITELKGIFRMDTVFAKFDITSSMGIAQGEAGIGLKDILSYSGKVKVQNFNLSKVLLDPSYESNINGDVDFSGLGDSPESLNISIKMNMFNSTVMDYSFNNFILDAKTTEPGKIHIDTLLIGFGEPVNLTNADSTSTLSLTERQYNERISMNGFLDIHDMTKPTYDLNASLKNINLSNKFGSKDMPEQLDANIKLIGEGFEPDRINAKINLEITKWKLQDKNLQPMNIDISMSRDDNNFKIFQLNSKISDITLKGNFNYLELIDRLNMDIEKLSNHLNDKIDNIFPAEIEENFSSSTLISQPTKEQNFELTFRLKDSELIKTILNFKKFDTDVYFEIENIYDNKSSNISIREFNLDKFILEDSSLLIQTYPTKIEGNFQISYLDNFSIAPIVKLNITSIGGINYNDLTFTAINAQIDYTGNNLNLGLNADINTVYKLISHTGLSFDKNKVDISIDKLTFQYSNKIGFTNNGPLLLSYMNKEINFNEFKLISDKLDLFDLNGILGEDYFKNLKLTIHNYNIEHIWEFLPRDEIEIGYDLKGHIDTLAVVLNGKFDKTDIDLNLSFGKISVGNSYFGNIEANLIHRNSLLSGDIRFFNPQSKLDKDYLNLKLQKIPLNMSISAEGERFNENKPIDLSLFATQLPLGILSPFITDVKNIRGFADITLNITGDNLKNIKYNGLISYYNTQFLLEANNMHYSSEGKIKFNTDTITVEKISLKNNPNDIANGEAIAKGIVILENLDLKAFDIKVYSNRFKLLSQASMKPMPSLFGDFVVSFGSQPMRIFGTPDAPYVRGEVNILRAALTMPNTTSTEVKKSILRYEIKPDSSYEFTIEPDTSKSIAETKIKDSKNNSKNKDGKSFGDLLDIDIAIKFKGRFVITMDITGIGQLYAEIGTQSQDDELRYVLKRGAEDAQIYGTDIHVKDGSTLKLIKMLDTKGVISIRKGNVDNPGLDLVATYKGQRYTTDIPGKYEVNMYIKGTKDLPMISFSYSIDDVEGTGDSSKINENALLLLTLGKTKEELQNSTAAGSDSYMSSATSIASTVASSALTEFVQSSSFIQSADIEIGSSLQNLDQARMKFSGDIKGIKWTLGGSVAEFANSNQITIDIPISSVFNIKGSNIILQLTKITNASQTSTTRNQKDWEIKLRVGGSW